MNNSSTVLKEMQTLRKSWRDQNFHFTKEQEERYNELLVLRRAFVTYWKENGMVWVGPSNAGKTVEEVEKEQEDS